MGILGPVEMGLVGSVGGVGGTAKSGESCGRGTSPPGGGEGGGGLADESDMTEEGGDELGQAGS